MQDHPDTERSTEPIEEMPAAPEADQGTRDADAPTWAAPTEGHAEPPLSSALAEADVDALTTAPVTAAIDAATPASSGARTTERPALISAERVEVTQGGAQRIEGHEVTVSQGGAAMIRGDQVRVEQGGAGIIIARRVDIREGGAFLLLARRVSGDVNVALDWRAVVAIVAGIIAILFVRGRR